MSSKSPNGWVAGAGSASTSSTLPPVGNGYLATGSGFVDFIQWNDDDGNLSGTAQVVVTQGQAPNLSTTNDTIPVSGKVNGSTISLSFSGSVSQFGTLSSGAFTIDFPQNGGTLAPLTFSSASASDYNTAVQNLETQISTTNTQYLAQQGSQGIQQVDNLCGTNTASCPQPPGVPQGYTALAAFDAAQPSGTVDFGGLPLEICYALAPGEGASIATLTYQIGNPVSGPDALFSSSGGSDDTGCVTDPANDTGNYPVVVATGGGGQWVVQIDQEIPGAPSG